MTGFHIIAFYSLCCHSCWVEWGWVSSALASATVLLSSIFSLPSIRDSYNNGGKKTQFRHKSIVTHYRLTQQYSFVYCFKTKGHKKKKIIPLAFSFFRSIVFVNSTSQSLRVLHRGKILFQENYLKLKRKLYENWPSKGLSVPLFNWWLQPFRNTT